MYAIHVKKYHSDLCVKLGSEFGKLGGKKYHIKDNDKNRQLRLKLMRYWSRTFNGK